ncbi:hypothetical protein CDAR_538841 [Caerostris darwini]|uniref:Uncharacterized protein n=1 Tax=Caerostris darwini TaxID=1538125 RepID=A0AAV4T480_9ARAC|nr:hypothetical protein CDAR_538841 [Caerostris darwini]
MRSGKGALSENLLRSFPSLCAPESAKNLKKKPLLNMWCGSYAPILVGVESLAVSLICNFIHPPCSGFLLMSARFVPEPSFAAYISSLE